MLLAANGKLINNLTEYISLLLGILISFDPSPTLLRLDLRREVKLRSIVQVEVC